MAQGIDALQIEISAKADSANRAINRLTKNLDKLSTSLNSLNVSNVGGLSTVANQTNAVASGSTKMNNALKKTNTTMKSTSKQAWSLARAFGKFYANYFLIIRGTKSLWKSIESTADYIEAYNYYNVAFGKIASEWKQDFAKFGYDNAETYANSFVGRMNETLGKLSGVQISVGADGKGLLTDTRMKNLGLNIQEITQYASQLASVTNSLGQTGETSLAISRSFTKLAGDISSLFNIDYSTVSKNLQSGLIGQSRALYKYGIDITNATLQTYAYKLGLTKAVSEMTQAEKQQLRMIAILDQSKVSWGDLANTINSPSNMIRQLSTNLKEAGMILGQLFIPMLEHVLPVVNGATIAIKRLLTEIAGFFGVEIDFEKFGQGYNELEDEVGDLSDSYDDLANSIKEVKSQLLGFDEVNKLSDTSATLSVGTEDNTIDLTDEIVSATKEYQKVWDEAFANMENTSQKWAGRIQTALDGIGDVFEDFAIGDFFKAGEDVSKLVIEFNKFIAKSIDGIDGKMVGQKFADFILGIDYSGVAKSLGEVVASAYSGLWDFGTGIGESISDKLIQWEFGDISKVRQWKEDYKAELSDIGTSYNDLITKAQTYADLSFNYDTLSEDEKSLVKKLSEELSAEIPGIETNINRITGAWEGTSESLDKAIRKQMLYTQVSAAQQTLADLYAELYAKQKELKAFHKENADMGFWGFVEYLIGFTDAEQDKIQGDIDYVSSTIEYMEKQVDMFNKQIDELNSAEISAVGVGAGAIDWENIIGSDTEKELDDFMEKLEKEKQMTEEYSKVFQEGVSSFNLFSRTNKNFKIRMDTKEIQEGKDMLEHFNSTGSNITVSPKINTGHVINGLNQIDTVFHDELAIWNSKAITPYINTSQSTKEISDFVTKANGRLSALYGKIKIDADTSPFIDKINKARQKLEEFEQKSNASSAVSSIFNASINAWSGIKGFANGGFVDEGQLFIAREAGPELVGSMGGRTAVANNDQITQGIAQAVYSAFTSALSTTNRGSSGDIIVNIDGKQVFKAVQKQATNYVAQTGQTPFPI